MVRTIFASAVALLALAAAPAQARMETITVHGDSLEGNLEGNSPDREVRVYLPDSYDSDSERRFPVVYFLHGYSLTAEGFHEFANLEQLHQQSGQDIILVLPDTFTRQKGSMYSNGPTVGDFETFVAEDLVEYIDANYRTLADPDSRGLAGHSMGGYGALKIGMRYADKYDAVYAMSACCLSPRTWTAEELQQLGSMSLEEMQSADFGTGAALASLAAWVPAPENGPAFFANGVTEGEVDTLAQARTWANSPVVMLPQYLDGLKDLDAFALDVGDADFLLSDNNQMHGELERFGVEHTYEVYEGDHVNRVAGRIGSKVLPFFAEHLEDE